MSTGVAVALAVAAGAGVGSALRYGAEVLQVRHRERRGTLAAVRLPVATLVVNVLGSALLGLVAGLLLREAIGPVVAAGLGAGVAGGLTTFSTFALEVVTLARGRALRTAVGYVMATSVLGVAAAALAFRAVAP